MRRCVIEWQECILDAIVLLSRNVMSEKFKLLDRTRTHAHTHTHTHTQVKCSHASHCFWHARVSIVIIEKFRRERITVGANPNRTEVLPVRANHVIYNVTFRNFFRSELLWFRKVFAIIVAKMIIAHYCYWFYTS